METAAGETYEGKQDNKLTETSFFLLFFCVFVCVAGRT